MADPVVRYEAHEKVSVITLNRPEKLNAISAELQRQLLAAFLRADQDAETNGVLLQAEGRSFCAGYDISAKQPGTDDRRSNPTKAHRHLSVQLDFSSPTASRPPTRSRRGRNGSRLRPPGSSRARLRRWRSSPR